MIQSAMAKRFEGSRVWITGGGSGIGRALAIAFSEAGAEVAVSGRRRDRLSQVVGDLRAAGYDGLAVGCDVTDESSVNSAVGRVAKEFGGLDVAIANAGFSVAGRIENLSAADWRRQLDVNVVGAAITASAALPHLRQTQGRLALVGSVAAQLPAPGVGAYVASKYAVRGIGQTLSIEMHDTGVTCTTLHPGFVQSEIAQVDNDGHFHEHAQDKRPKNLMWPAERAASAMLDAIYKRKREYVFTGHGKIGAFVGRHLPGMAHWAMTRRGHKSGFNTTTKG